MATATAARPAPPRADMARLRIPAALPIVAVAIVGLFSTTCATQSIPHDGSGGVLVRDGEAFPGELEEWSEGHLISRVPYVDGRTHVRALAFHPDGELRHERYYERGRKEGTHRGYWENGQLQFVRRYHRDLLEGEQEGYYRNGARAELLRY